jgi:NitT/TauT family transport system substrate-binding protein
VFKSALDRDTAMQTGNLDGVMADMLTIVFYNEAGLKSKITSQTYGSYVMVTTPNLDRDAFFKIDPVRVGISANTVIDFVTDQIAYVENMNDKVEAIAIPQMPVRLEMLGVGELDAATLPEPLASAAVLNGGEKVSGTLDLGLQPGIFIMTDSSLEGKAFEIQALYEGYNQGVDYLNSTSQDEYIELLVDQLGFPPSLVGKFQFPELSHAQPADEVTFDTVVNWMMERGLTTSKMNFSEAFTSKFIK